MKEAVAKKVFVLGIDGMDPRFTKHMLAQGKMPNVQKLIDRGVCREDLVMLGGNPTVTPPMWTTLATGTYPMTHGITGFYRHSKEDLDVLQYNLDSRLCKAEPVWNCFAEAGKKTLVWHWPGSSWPPTSDSSNLYVVDGTSPGSVAMGPNQVEGEYFLIAGEQIDKTGSFVTSQQDFDAPCVITGMETKKEENAKEGEPITPPADIRHLLVGEPGEGSAGKQLVVDLPIDGDAPADFTVDIIQSPIKAATGWANSPENAKEFTLTLSGGLLRRPCMILADENGVYKTIAVYKSKKETEPLAIVGMDKITQGIVDESYRGEEKFRVTRAMRVLSLKEDGSELRMWVSAAMDIDNDSVFYPKRIYKDLINNVGYIPSTTQIGMHEADFITKCQLANWYDTADWQSDCIHYLIEQENIEAVFSHFHNVDLEMHMIVRRMKDKGLNRFPESVYEKYAEDIYVQTDYYIGKYLHLLDEGWTILLVSDHAQVCPTHSPTFFGDLLGVNVPIMEELGFTVLKRDENGNKLKEIDWEKTKAIAIRENDIYINVKGRDKYGIVEPGDKYEVEEEVMTALYGYKHPATGKRVIALAVRNRDAAVFGLGGPECGDIVYFTAEGYNYDHADGLSTAYGEKETSLSPIFVGAGPGFTQGKTDRVVRQVDIAPTVALLGGVRIPKECEGAPLYQIMDMEF